MKAPGSNAGRLAWWKCVLFILEQRLHHPGRGLLSVWQESNYKLPCTFPEEIPQQKPWFIKPERLVYAMLALYLFPMTSFSVDAVRLSVWCHYLIRFTLSLPTENLLTLQSQLGAAFFSASPFLFQTDHFLFILFILHISCHDLNCVLQDIHLLEFLTPEPQNVTVLGDRTFSSKIRSFGWAVIQGD
jgi:hypothetical protein